MIDRIGHINIRTKAEQFEKTLSFYEQLLGLKRADSLATPGADNLWLFADSGRAIVHVNSVEMGGDVEPDGVSTGRLNHVAFDCRDYEQAMQRIQAMGLKHTRYETKAPGLFLVVTKDPINNIVIELSFGTDNVMRPDLHQSTGPASRKLIMPPSLPKPPVPYTPGVLVGDVLYVAGILSLADDMKTTVGVGDIRVQTRQVIETIKTIVEEAGGTLQNITFNSIFLRNLQDYAGMNEVYGEYFKEAPPARYCIRADLVPPDCLVEIASVAHLSR